VLGCSGWFRAGFGDQGLVNDFLSAGAFGISSSCVLGVGCGVGLVCESQCGHLPKSVRAGHTCAGVVVCSLPSCFLQGSLVAYAVHHNRSLLHKCCVTNKHQMILCLSLEVRSTLDADGIRCCVC
jgi:hypothetical protein